MYGGGRFPAESSRQEPLRQVPPRGRGGKAPVGGGTGAPGSSSSVYQQQQTRKSKTTMQPPGQRVYAPQPKHQHGMVLPDPVLLDQQMQREVQQSKSDQQPNYFSAPATLQTATTEQAAHPHAPSPTGPSMASTGSIPLDGRHLELLQQMKIRNGQQKKQQQQQQPPVAGGNDANPPGGMEAFWKQVKTADDLDWEGAKEGDAKPEQTPTTTSTSPKPKQQGSLSSPSSTSQLGRRASSSPQNVNPSGRGGGDGHGRGRGGQPGTPTRPKSPPAPVGKGQVLASFIESCFDPVGLTFRTGDREEEGGGSRSFGQEARRILATHCGLMQSAPSSSSSAPQLGVWTGTVCELSYLLSELWALCYRTSCYLAGFDPSNPKPFKLERHAAKGRPTSPQRGSQGGSPQQGRVSGGRSSEQQNELAAAPSSFTAVAKRMGEARNNRNSNMRNNNPSIRVSRSQGQSQDGHLDSSSYLLPIEWMFLTQTAAELRYRRPSFFACVPTKTAVTAMVELFTAGNTGTSSAQEEEVLRNQFVSSACSRMEVELAVESMVNSLHELLVFLLWVSAKYSFPKLAAHFRYQREIDTCLAELEDSVQGKGNRRGGQLDASDFLVPADVVGDVEYEATAGLGYWPTMDWPPRGFPLQRRLNERVGTMKERFQLEDLSSGQDLYEDAEDAGEGGRDSMDAASRYLLGIISDPDATGFELVAGHDDSSSGSSYTPIKADHLAMLQRQHLVALKRLEVSWKRYAALNHTAGTEGRYTSKDVLVCGAHSDAAAETLLRLLQVQRQDLPQSLAVCAKLRRDCLGLVTQRMRALELSSFNGGSDFLAQFDLPDAPTAAGVGADDESEGEETRQFKERRRDDDLDEVGVLHREVEQFWREVKASHTTATGGATSTSSGERQERRFAQDNSEAAAEVQDSVGHVSYFELSLQSCMAREFLRNFSHELPSSLGLQKGRDGPPRKVKADAAATAFLSDAERDAQEARSTVSDPVVFSGENLLVFPSSIQSAIDRCHAAVEQARANAATDEDAEEEDEPTEPISKDAVKEIFLRHPGSTMLSCVGPRSALPSGSSVSNELVMQRVLRPSFQAESQALFQQQTTLTQSAKSSAHAMAGGLLNMATLGIREVKCQRSNEGAVKSPEEGNNNREKSPEYI